MFLQKKINLTKTIRKLPIKDNLERAGYYVHDDLANQEVKYDSHEEWFKVRGIEMVATCYEVTYGGMNSNLSRDWACSYGMKQSITRPQ